MEELIPKHAVKVAIFLKWKYAEVYYFCNMPAFHHLRTS